MYAFKENIWKKLASTKWMPSRNSNSVQLTQQAHSFINNTPTSIQRHDDESTLKQCLIQRRVTSIISFKKRFHHACSNYIHIGAPVAQWLRYWSSGPTSILARGEIFSTVNGAPLHKAFHYQPPIVLIYLRYRCKGRKIANHPSIQLHNAMHTPRTLWLIVNAC